jgi:hypothetical protein
MFNAYLTLLMAFAVAIVVGWFSIAGIMTIYAGAPLFAALVMGVVIECSKLVSLSWLYRNWKSAGLLLRAPLVIIALAVMLITNIGVFGFLSKGHLEQGASTIDNSAKVEQLNRQITQEKSRIIDSEKIIAQMDGAVNSLIGKDQATRSLSVRRSQSTQRKQLRDEITASEKQIDTWNAEKFTLESEVRKVEHEIGPIKYIAEVFINSDNKKSIDTAVQVFTLLIVLVLDPAAVMLLLAANHSLSKIRDEKEKKEKFTVDSYRGQDASTETKQEINSGVLSYEFIPEGTLPIHENNIPVQPSTEVHIPIQEPINEKTTTLETEDGYFDTGILEQKGTEISFEGGYEEGLELTPEEHRHQAELSILPMEMEQIRLDENLAHENPQSINEKEDAILEKFGSTKSLILQTPPTSFILQPTITRVQQGTEETNVREAKGKETSTIPDILREAKGHIGEEILPQERERLTQTVRDRTDATWYWSTYSDGAPVRKNKEIKTLSWLKTFGKE